MATKKAKKNASKKGTRTKHAAPKESEIRQVLAALQSSGILERAATIGREAGKRRLLAQVAQQTTVKLHEDVVVCNTEHYFFIVKPVPPAPNNNPPGGGQPGPKQPPSQ